ncbi:hypothetical protein JCM24511_02074 [Saitozyma sp. JCM 24511]|nr:hypothetical protein JCM24511_02074 [Saitozyma sp. JCM 24511]
MIDFQSFSASLASVSIIPPRERMKGLSGRSEIVERSAVRASVLGVRDYGVAAAETQGSVNQNSALKTKSGRKDRLSFEAKKISFFLMVNMTSSEFSIAYLVLSDFNSFARQTPRLLCLRLALWVETAVSAGGGVVPEM